MLRIILILLPLLSAWCAVAGAEDLYKVAIQCEADAEKLRAAGVAAVVSVDGGCLVLAADDAAASLKASGLGVELVAANVDRERLAMDRRSDRVEDGRYPLVYAEGGLKIRRVDVASLPETPERADWAPIRVGQAVIKYHPPRVLNERLSLGDIDLDSLISLVNQDSVQAYTQALQDFGVRLTGTAACYAARNWLAAKFASFGYSPVVIDSFTGSQLYDRIPVPSQNVIAYKTGTTYPTRQIIVGGHYDAVPGSPGADDNASGTAGVLEIARVLRHVPTEVSFVFIAFDSEESWMWGSYHYVEEAVSRGDDIEYMLNLDMIGYYPNSDQANLYPGPHKEYAELWDRLADSLVGIHGLDQGTTASDHLPFQDYGYDVTFVQEFLFSAQYHQSNDNTSYLNFDYMTRMIKGSLAALKVIDAAPPAVTITSVRDVGNGQSLYITWQPWWSVHNDHYRLYYNTVPATQEGYVDIDADSSRYFLPGLTEGQQYRVRMVAFDDNGHSSISYTEAFGTPRLRPLMPQSLVLAPRYRAIGLNWQDGNTELDFSHYQIIRDGVRLPAHISGTSYIDDDFLLGSDFHSYLVVAVDRDGLASDTTGAKQYTMRAATLDPGHILAINRSSKTKSCLVNEVVTGQFLRETLAGFDFDYYSDTAYGSYNRGDTLHLVDLLNYELLVIGAESGRADDLGSDPGLGGILDTLCHYLSIGGKVIVISRWGDLTPDSNRLADTIYFESGTPNYGYTSYFDMNYRVLPLSPITPTRVSSDLIGAHSLDSRYPDLIWDSLATIDHSSPWLEVTGIPCPVFARLTGAPQVIYTYDSRGQRPLTHGQPVAWRHITESYGYIFFAVPFSFMQRAAAIVALQAAVSELASEGPPAATTIEPDTVNMVTGPATVDVFLGDFVSGKAAADVNTATIRINNKVVPVATTILPSYPPYSGPVLQVTVPTDSFFATYGVVTNTVARTYRVSWKFSGESRIRYAGDSLTLIGKSFVAGDPNGDGLVNIGDAVFVVNYVFKGGPNPNPPEAGDPNCDHAINVGDAVYIINYVFKGGPAPCYP